MKEGTGKCDCYIGTVGNDCNLYLSNVVEQLNDLSRSMKDYPDFGVYKDILEPKEILDKRRGYVHRFNFCPYCGSKVNWQEIKSQV